MFIINRKIHLKNLKDSKKRSNNIINDYIDYKVSRKLIVIIQLKKNFMNSLINFLKRKKCKKMKNLYINKKTLLYNNL